MNRLIWKRIYEKAEDDDGFRVFVDRLWARGIKKEMMYYYLAREWSSDDDRLKKDLELTGMDLKPLTINNIFTTEAFEYE